MSNKPIDIMIGDDVVVSGRVGAKVIGYGIVRRIVIAEKREINPLFSTVGYIVRTYDRPPEILYCTPDELRILEDEA